MKRCGCRDGCLLPTAEPTSLHQVSVSVSISRCRQTNNDRDPRGISLRRAVEESKERQSMKSGERKSGCKKQKPAGLKREEGYSFSKRSVRTPFFYIIDMRHGDGFFAIVTHDLVVFWTSEPSILISLPKLKLAYLHFQLPVNIVCSESRARLLFSSQVGCEVIASGTSESIDSSQFRILFVHICTK